VGGYERSSTNGCVQGFDTLFWDDNRINALSLPTGRQAMPRKTVIMASTYIFYPPRLHRPLIPSLPPRSDSYRELSGKCGNYCPSPRRTFHSSRRSGSVYSLFFYCFLKALMVLSCRLGIGTFLLQKKN
jgi:hypothetical protein